VGAQYPNPDGPYRHSLFVSIPILEDLELDLIYLG
jgi:hypothetical protein